MDWALYFKAVVLGVVEGLTEFLPISSTGHLIIAGQLIGYTGDKAKVFEIVIQSGAMLAVIWEYRARFSRMLGGLRRDPAARRFAVNLAVAFLPAALLGLAFAGAIKQHLFHAVPVAAAFILGGIIILWVERSPRRITVEQVDDIAQPFLGVDIIRPDRFESDEVDDRGELVLDAMVQLVQQDPVTPLQSPQEGTVAPLELAKGASLNG